jgi:hypothetical protein
MSQVAATDIPRRRRKALAVTAVPLAAAAMVAGSAGVASAFSGAQGNYNGNGVNIRSAPNLNAASRGLGQRSQGQCHDSADPRNNSSITWWPNKDVSTGISGWSDDVYLGSNLNPCSW